MLITLRAVWIATLPHAPMLHALKYTQQQQLQQKLMGVPAQTQHVHRRLVRRHKRTRWFKAIYPDAYLHDLTWQSRFDKFCCTKWRYQSIDGAALTGASWMEKRSWNLLNASCFHLSQKHFYNTTIHEEQGLWGYKEHVCHSCPWTSFSSNATSKKKKENKLSLWTLWLSLSFHARHCHVDVLHLDTPQKANAVWNIRVLEK